MSKVAANVARKQVATSKQKGQQNGHPIPSFEPLFYGDWEKSLSSARKRRAFIQKICDRIVTAFRPEKIILFGSQAYGKPTPESDIDMLVVMPYEGGAMGQAIKILKTLKLLLPLDLLVRSSEEIQERIRIGDRFIKEITEKGKVLYDASHFGVD